MTDSNKKYGVFSETNYDDMETWITFISKAGNENTLALLKKQLEEIDWGEAPEYTGMFAIDTRGVSCSTAREMMFVDLNTNYAPNKFDGKMKNIDFEFGKRDSDETKAVKVYGLIGRAHVCDFLGEEDLDGCSLKDDDEESAYSSESESEMSSRRQPPIRESLDISELPAILGKAYRAAGK